ncbi:MAG: TIGR03915 family putative DNA repair protein [Bacillota bacterium]
MITYIYDGSFTGFMTLVFDSFKTRRKPTKIVKEIDYRPDLLSRVVKIDSDGDKADTVIKYCKDRLSLEIFKQAYRAFLSEQPGVELAIYEYMYQGLSGKTDLNNTWTGETVLFIKKLARRVNRENHLYRGLLRFRQLEDGIFYAPFKPEYNISSLLAPHFARRFQSQRWIIHDCARDLCVIWNRKEWIEISADMLPEFTYSNEESQYQKLWQDFFNNISIETRKNKKLQANFIPLKHRDFLIEFSD